MKITKEEFEADKKVLEKYFGEVDLRGDTNGSYFLVSDDDSYYDDITSRYFSITEDGDQ